MTDKDKQIILAEIEKRMENAGQYSTGAYNGMKEIRDYISSLPEEPVSEDLEEALEEFIDSIMGHIEFNSATPFAAEYVVELLEEAFKAGAQWQKANLWKPADGDDLPEYEREVVVFTQNFPNDAGMMRVAIGHRPNPDGWDGKSITTGEVKHYTPKTYEKGGWNIPDIVYWLDVELPKE